MLVRAEADTPKLWSRSRGRSVLLLILLFIQPGTPAHVMVPSAFRVGFPTSVKPLGDIEAHLAVGLHGYRVSMVILNPVKLTMKISHHSRATPAYCTVPGPWATPSGLSPALQRSMHLWMLPGHL